MMIIQGVSVFLRPVRQSDMKSIHQASQNEEIRNLIGQTDSFSQRQLTDRYKQYIKDPSRYDFAVCLLRNKRIIGNVSIQHIDLESKKADFRIVIHKPELVNKGYGTEATLLAQDFVFKKLVLNRLELKVLSHNEKGIRLCEKTGFKKEGFLRQSLYFNHQYSDDILMGMIRVDYNYSRPTSWLSSFMTANV